MNLEITDLDIVDVKKILDELQLTNHMIVKSETMPISSIILTYFSNNKSKIDISIAFVPLPENVFSDIKILGIVNYLNELNISSISRVPLTTFMIGFSKFSIYMATILNKSTIEFFCSSIFEKMGKTWQQR